MNPPGQLEACCNPISSCDCRQTRCKAWWRRVVKDGWRESRAVPKEAELCLRDFCFPLVPLKKMNSGDCWWNVWAGVCLRGRIRESGGAGTGAMGTPLAGTKSTCVHRHCVPSPQGKGVTQRYLFRSFTCFSLLLCTVIRDPYHFRIPPPHPSWSSTSTGPACFFQGNLLSDHDRVPPMPLIQGQRLSAGGAASGRNTCKEPQLWCKLLS